MAEKPTSATGKWKPFPNGKTAWLFSIGLMLGGFAWFRVVGVAFFAPREEAFQAAAFWWFSGAALVSAIIAACQPSTRLHWSLGFAAPIAAWCAICTFYAFGDVRFLWWPLLGGITATTALIGALIGQILAKKLR